MQIDQAVEEFLAGYFSTSLRSTKTKVAYSTDLAQFTFYFGGGEAVELIKVESLERWAAELAARGYAPVSIRRKFATIRVFFAYWVRKGKMASSPLWQIRLDLGRERRLPRSLTAADAKCLVEQAWGGVSPLQSEITIPSDQRFLSAKRSGNRRGSLSQLECVWAKP